MNEEEIKKIIKEKYFTEKDELDIELAKLSVPYLIKLDQTKLDREISDAKLFLDLFGDKGYSNKLYYYENENIIHLFFVTCADNPISFTTGLITRD